MVRLSLPLWDEAHIEENFLDLILCVAQRLDIWVHKHVLDAAQVGLLPLDIGLRQDGPDVVGVQKAFTDLMIFASTRVVFMESFLPDSPYFSPWDRRILVL